MTDLLLAALPTFGVSVPLLLLVALAGVMRPGWRVATAVFLLLGAIGALALAVTHAGAVLTTDVLNPLPGALEPLVTDQATAPSWMPWAAIAAILLIPAVLMLLRRNHEPHHPHPLGLGLLLALWVIGARLMLEQAAAPQSWVWAVGLTPALLVILPVAGAMAGYRGMDFLEFLLALLLMAIGQRGLLTAIGFFATTRQLGTHLDVNAVTELHLPLLGARSFGVDDAISKWLYAVALPQMVPWVLATVVAGALLGGLAFVIARRRSGY